MASRAGAVTLNQPRDTSVGSPSNDVDFARFDVKGNKMSGPAPPPEVVTAGWRSHSPV